MNHLQSLSDDALHEQTLASARKEQEQTLVTLRHLEEVYRRRLYSKLGYESLFAYTVRALGFSEPAAAQRVQALRLLTAVPTVAAKIESGELSLTTAAAVQRFCRREEKEVDRVVSAAEKAELVARVFGQSTREVERTLLSASRAPEEHRFREITRLASVGRTELRFFADEKLMAISRACAR